MVWRAVLNKWFNNLSMQNKFLLTITILTLSSTLAIGWNIMNFIGIGNDTAIIYQQNQKLSSLLKSQIKFLSVESDYRSYLLTNEEYYRKSYEVKSQEISRDISNAILNADSLDERKDINTLNKDKYDYEWTLADIVDTRYTYGEDEEVGWLLEEIESEAYPFLDLLDSMTGKMEQELVIQQDSVNRKIKSLVVTDIFILLLLTMLVIIAAIIANQIAEPVLHLTNAIIAFENNTYEPDLVNSYIKERNEVGKLARAFNDMATTITEASRQKDQYLTATTRFVPSAYLDFLEKKSIVDVKLGDHISAEMAVMFSDIRSFTSISEYMSAQENFEFVNEYLKMVSPCIEENNGFIVKYLGDGMMAIFPYSVDDAVQAAINKKILVQQFNLRRIISHQPMISVGIGIHTGHMMVGIIGEERRMQGDAFSDHVNLTSRVESLTRFFDVALLITEEALMRLENKLLYNVRFMGRVRVLGKENPLSLYEIFDGDDDEIFKSKLESRSDFELGLKEFLRGDFCHAQHLFSSALARNPSDKAANFYFDQSKEMRNHQIPEDWDGVVIMNHK